MYLHSLSSDSMPVFGQNTDNYTSALTLLKTGPAPVVVPYAHQRTDGTTWCFMLLEDFQRASATISVSLDDAWIAKSESSTHISG